MGDHQSDAAAMMQAAVTQLTGMVSGLQGEVQRSQVELAKTREQTAAASVQPPALTVVAGSKEPKVKLSIPEKYDGSSQPGAAENFLFWCEQYFLGMDTPADKQVLIAACLLIDGAASW
jgi:hypothetical protein